MGNNIGSAVNQNGITREQFQASLHRNGIKGDKFDKAMTIFDKYAGMNTEATGEDACKILDEQEQVMARNDFAQLNQDDDNNVSKKEYKKHGGKEKFGVNYNTAKAYMEAMEHAAQNSGNDNPVGEMVVTDDGAVVVYGSTTDDTADDDFRIYTKGQNGQYNVSEPEEESVQTEAVPEVEPEAEPEPTQQPPKFQNKDELGNTVVKYLLNMSADEAVDAGINFGEKFEYSVAEDGTATVKFDGKEYTARTNSDGKIVFENDEGEGSTLQQAVLNSESTDKANNYYNRGRKGNLKSTYNAETGEITNNSGTGRQGVSQVQTLSSMIMNNNESTTMKLDGQLQADDTRKALDGATIIASIDTKDDDSKGKITKSELIRYLNATVNEANATTESAKSDAPGGSRIYAPNVDLDLKDLANIGIVFDKYAGDDKMLDAGELDKLLADLKNNSMSKLAGKDGTYKYEGAKEPLKQSKPEPAKPKEDEPFKREFGDVATADRTRKNTAGGSVTYTYSGGAGGTRSMVADDGTGTTRIVKNANVAEYEDHGMFDMGKKEFLVIQGLEQNVRAEVVDGEAEGSMTIKVKDSSGNITYRQVTYDAESKTYSQGEQVYKNKAGQYRTSAQRNADGKKLLGLDKGVKLPKGFSFDYDKKGEIVCKFNGARLENNVAKVMIMRVNTQQDGAVTKSVPNESSTPTVPTVKPQNSQPIDTVPDVRPAEDSSRVDNTPTVSPSQDNTPVNTVPNVRSSADGRMSEQDIKNYKATDKNYQNRKQTVASWDSDMKTIEEKYGFKRDDTLDALRKLNGTDDDKLYSDLKSKMRVYGNNFEKRFENILKKWVNTPEGAPGATSRRNGRTLFDVKQETLPDGTKVYHAKDVGGREGYYNLYFDGLPGEKMSDEELKEHGLKNIE